MTPWRSGAEQGEAARGVEEFDLATRKWAFQFWSGLIAQRIAYQRNLAPVLLPEYRAPDAGRIDLASVALSLAAMLPAIYGVKQMAKDGFAPGALAAIAVGVAFGVFFVRRQHRLADPLLDMTLFRRTAFTVSLVVLLLGLVAVGGTLLLVTQYLQLVRGFSALEAGLWMGPSALAMVAAGVSAPLLARRVRPGFVVAGALALSSLDYGLLATVTTEASDLALVVAGFSLAYLGLGAIAALGTDLVVGSAPPEKAGSASAMSETVQDLGASLGIALLGSLATALYRSAMLAEVPADLSTDARTAVSDSLWATLAIAPDLPAGVVANAQDAFVAGLNGAAVASAVVVALLAVLAAATLRRVSTAH